MSEKKYFCSKHGVPMPQVIDGECSYVCDNQMFHVMEDHFSHHGKPVNLIIKNLGKKCYAMYELPIQEDNQ